MRPIQFQNNSGPVKAKHKRAVASAVKRDHNMFVQDQALSSGPETVGIYGFGSQKMSRNRFDSATFGDYQLVSAAPLKSFN